MNMPRIQFLTEMKETVEGIRVNSATNMADEYDYDSGQAPFIQLCQQFEKLIDALLRNEI